MKVLIAIVLVGLSASHSQSSLAADDPQVLSSGLKSDDIAQQVEASERLAELGEKVAEDFRC